jgi:uncharacterized protein YjbI with pentapeptide repeats
LSEAKFTHADLSGADLSDASLYGTVLSSVALPLANLRRANLSGAIFQFTELAKSDLTEAQVGNCVFANSGFNQVQGLETVFHYAPSTIGLDTILESEGKLPEIFLRGCGLPDHVIAYAKSLATNPIKFYSCFISYSSKDGSFVTELYTQLQAQGVRCWKDSEDLKIGDRF